MQSPDDPTISGDRKRFARGASTLLAAGFLVLAAVVFALVWLAHRNEGEVAWVQHTQDVEIRLSRLLGLIRDAESGQRGYLLTGDERYLTPYRASADATAGEIDGLAERVADNPRQSAALATLRPLVAAKLQELRETVDLRRAGDADAAASAVRTDRGLALMRDIRETLDGMRAEEDALLAARIAEAQRGAALLMAGAACGGGLLAILAVFSVRSVHRYTNAVDAAHRALLEAHRRRIVESEERRHVEEALHQAQKMESVGQLTGGIAHDFNNLLTIVSGNLDLLEGRVEHDPATARLVRTAAGAAQRAEALTKQLLAFAHRQELRPVTLDVNQVVLGVQDLLRQTVGPAIELRFALAPDLWPTTADKSQIEIALLNLAVNARDAMPAGGSFAVETDNVAFDADAAAAYPDLAPGAYVRLAVRDTGCGMPPDVVRRAFEPFFTTKGVGKGTGLGLSMVFGFVRQSKGHVQIESEPDRGTAILVHLPRAEAAPADSSG